MKMVINKNKIGRLVKFIFKNKLKLIVAIFVIWIVFFDENSIIQLIKHNNDIAELQEEKQFLKDKILSDSIKLNQLKTDDVSLEKFAREQYFMHKPNEDVFVVEN